MCNYTSLQNNSLENQLIILCSQTTLGVEKSERIAELLSRTLDWSFIKKVASRNGVLPLVSWNLLNNFAESLPPEIEDELSGYLNDHTGKNLHATLKLLETVKILEEAGISILPFKGTTLAKRAYNNLALRQYVDLDVLVKPKDFDRTIEILSDSGYKIIGDPNNLRRKSLFINRKKDVGLLSPDESVTFELHWKLSGSHFALPYEIDELWNRLETIEIGGSIINALPFCDLFVYLCLHGSRHKWAKFSWVCDLHELILLKENSEENFDWKEVHRHAKKYGCEKVVELGLFLVKYFFNVEVGYPGFEAIENDEKFLKIARQMQDENFSIDEISSDMADWYLYHLTLKERKIDRLRLHNFYLLWYLRIALKPNALDEQVFHLPPLFYPFYYILRPFRLFFTYFGSDSEKKKTF